MNNIKTHFRTCTLCEAMCGIEITTKDDNILTIKGDKNDPFSQGHFCAKAPALQDIHEDVDRIKKPLLRTETGWQEVSWTYALDTVADKIKAIQKKHGKDAIGIYAGNPSAHNFGGLLLNSYLYRALATKNRFSATSVDQLPHHIVCSQLFGHQLFIPVPDIDHTGFMIIIGGNPLVSNGSIMTVPNVKKRLKAIKQRGGKLVVIDPRHTETAKIADQHLFIKPATDVLLLLSMVNTLFAQKKVTLGKLSEVIGDISQLEHFVAPYTAEKVSTICDISADKITQLVTDFCQAKSAVCYGRMGVSVQEFGTLCQYLIMVFNILTGNLDKQGGLMFTKPAANILPTSGRGRFSKTKSRIRDLPIFGGEKPVASLADEILTPGSEQIKAMIFFAGNPILSTPNSEQLDQAFSQLDFSVAIDFYLTETSRHANIILPPVSPLEREHYDIIFHLFQVRNTAKYSPALFIPEKNTKQDWQITTELAKRLMTNAPLKKKLALWFSCKLGPTGILNSLLLLGSYSRFRRGNQHKLSIKTLKKHPHGIDLGALQPCLPEGLYHKNKKINLAIDFYCADLVRVQQQFFSKTNINTKTTDKAQLLLIGRRHVRSNNSWLHNSTRLVRGKTRCTALLHPDDASFHKLIEGQTITVNSRVGKVDVVVEISNEIMPGVISIPHGWGHNKPGVRWQNAVKKPGVNLNDLTDERLVDQLSGNAALNGVPVWLSTDK